MSEVVPGDGSSVPDFDSISNEIIRVFGFDESSKELIFNTLTLGSNAYSDAADLIERSLATVAKRKPRISADMSEIIRQIRASSNSNDTDDFIAFVILYAGKQKSLKRAKRQQRIADANAALKPLDTNVQQENDDPVQKSQKSTKRISFDVKSSSKTRKQSRSRSRRNLAPIAINEQMMIDAAFPTLFGIDGRFTVRSRLSEESEFCFDSENYTMDDVLRSQFLRFIGLGNCYNKIQHHAKHKCTDLIAQAFYGCLTELNAEYTDFVAYIVAQQKKDIESVTALNLSIQMNEWHLTLPLIVELAEDNKNLNGMQILNRVYSYFCCLVPGSRNYLWLYKILKSMLEIFHDFLRNWLLYGIVDDRANGWMFAAQNSPLSVEGNSWTDGFKIVDSGIIPVFRKCNKIVDKIFVIGKSMKLLRNLNSPSSPSSIEIECRRLIDEVEPAKIYIDISEALQFSYQINKIYKKVGSEVLKIMEKYCINEHATTIRNHFFLMNECIGIEFYEQLCAITEGDMESLNPRDASIALKNAISNCKSISEEVSKMARIEATCGYIEDGQGDRLISICNNCGGFSAIHLLYVTSEPISFIFNQSVMERYNRAFEMIWTIMCTDFQTKAVIEEAAQHLKNLRKIWPGQVRKKFAAVTSHLLQMSHFIFLLRSHIVNEIEQITKKFLLDLNAETCGDLDLVIKANHIYLDTIEDGIFLSDSTSDIRNSLMAGIGLINETLQKYYPFKEQSELLYEQKKEVLWNYSTNPQGVKKTLSNCSVGSVAVDTEHFELDEKSAAVNAEMKDCISLFVGTMKDSIDQLKRLIADGCVELSISDRKSHADLSEQLRLEFPSPHPRSVVSASMRSLF